MGASKLNRVVFVTPWFPNVPGDREGNFIFSSAAALARAQLSVGVLVVRPWLTFALSRLKHKSVTGRFDPRAFSEFGRVELIRYLYVPRKRLPRISAWLHDLRVAEALTSFARTFDANLIHAHTEGAAPAAITAGHRLALPVIVTLHGINTASRYYDAQASHARFKSALSAASRVVLVGKPLENYFAEFLGHTNHFRIVPNGFDPPEMERGMALANDLPLRFISISNLHEGKGIDVALKAMAKARSQGLEDFTYTIVGDGSDREQLTTLAASLGLQAHVRFVGACRYNQVYTFLREADVFLLPSYREAFGIAYLEAMAVGLLAIAVQGEGPSMFIRDGETGLLVPPRDVGALAELLITIAANRKLMQRIAARGCTYVIENFTWDHHAQKLSALYCEVEQAWASRREQTGADA